jgi:2-polyprenyl-6-methoxyphenol hydroxylase-like FAD-dependent oxidoreductase
MDMTVVVGGGIGGLVCAIAVSRAGRPVTVLERRVEVADADAGTGLAMWDAVRALDPLGWATTSGVSVGQGSGRGSSPEALTELLLGALPDGLVRTGG